MTLRRHPLAPPRHRWLRVASPDWDDPIDPSFAQRVGGRWNPPDSWPTLYLNRDLATARAQVSRLLEGTPIAADDLADDAFDLVTVRLPEAEVVDIVTPAGVAAARLPRTYPIGSDGSRVPHTRCQRIGVRAHESEAPGLEARSALGDTNPEATTELAWFGAGARLVGERIPYSGWR